MARKSHAFGWLIVFLLFWLVLGALLIALGMSVPMRGVIAL